jgi:3-phosphoshikimate 1-carboxyvinyltransferase
VTDPIAIPQRFSLDAEVSIPGSKSCSARALVMAGLTQGRSILSGLAVCDDTDHMLNGLRGLGLSVGADGANVQIDAGDWQSPTAPLMLGNSGTAVRFLTAACASLCGTAVIDGVARMRERPIEDILPSLQAWGVEVDAPTGCPPVTVTSTGVFGGETSINGAVSSQYLTGLMLVAPRAERDVVIRVEGELVSKPYIDLTIAMMAERGVEVVNDDYRALRIAAPQAYAPGDYAIEADASGASYFLAAPAIAGGRVRVRKLTSGSHQGDAQFAKVLAQMGCTVNEGPDWIEVQSGDVLTGIDIDLNDMPDMAQTLAVVALFADGPTTIRNVENMRVKETDRISASVTELRKLGAEVEEFRDGLKIVPGPFQAAAIGTYDDHRMAMSFAMAGLRIPGVVINDPGCVSKTFPDFFDRFLAL